MNYFSGIEKEFKTNQIICYTLDVEFLFIIKYLFKYKTYYSLIFH
jgi:hypothetical protein